MYRLHLAKPADLGRVSDFFGRHRILVRHEPCGAVQVSVPTALTVSHAENELAGCITAWNALNPANPVGMFVPLEWRSTTR